MKDQLATDGFLVGAAPLLLFFANFSVKSIAVVDCGDLIPGRERDERHLASVTRLREKLTLASKKCFAPRTPSCETSISKSMA